MEDSVEVSADVGGAELRQKSELPEIDAGDGDLAGAEFAGDGKDTAVPAEDDDAVRTMGCQEGGLAEDAGADELGRLADSLSHGGRHLGGLGVFGGPEEPT